jgi:cell division septal protein FtsQ
VEGIQPKVMDKRVEMIDELSEVLQLLKALLPWQSEITKVNYRREDLTVLFASGLTVLFGHASDVSTNVPILQTILTNLEKTGKLKNVEYIDLRYNGKPVIREK